MQVEAVEGVPEVHRLEVLHEHVFGRRLDRDRLERSGLGRRARSLVSLRRGKYTRARLGALHEADVAVDATLRAAALRARCAPLRVEAQDLRRKVREHRSPFAVCLVLDNSYSLQAERMVEKAKGIVLGLLEEATRRGDRVALVAYKGGVAEATVALPLTASAAFARRRLRRVPLSGRTPLADALRRARRLLQQELRRHPNAVPLLVVVTDGLPTVPRRPGGDPVADVLAEARVLRRARIPTVVAEASAPQPGSCCAELARLADGVLVPLAQLAPSALAGVLDSAA
jgi:magnesium chelatase subunit D